MISYRRTIVYGLVTRYGPQSVASATLVKQRFRGADILEYQREYSTKRGNELSLYSLDIATNIFEKFFFFFQYRRTNYPSVRQRNFHSHISQVPLCPKRLFSGTFIYPCLVNTCNVRTFLENVLTIRVSNRTKFHNFVDLWLQKLLRRENSLQ